VSRERGRARERRIRHGALSEALDLGAQGATDLAAAPQGRRKLKRVGIVALQGQGEQVTGPVQVALSQEVVEQHLVELLRERSVLLEVAVDSGERLLQVHIAVHIRSYVHHHL